MRIQTTSMTTPATERARVRPWSGGREATGRIAARTRLVERHASTAAASSSHSATTTTAKKFCSLNAVTTGRGDRDPDDPPACEVRVISPATSSISAPARIDVASVLM